MQQAIRWFQLGCYDQAEQAFQQQRQTSSSVLPTFYLAQIAQLKGQGALWIKPLEQLLYQSRDFADGYYVLAQSYQQNRQLPQAVQALYQALTCRLQQCLIKPEIATITATDVNAQNTQACLPEQAQELLWQVLAQFYQAKVYAFATAGTLLGLERSGKLLSQDKDIDVGVDWLQMDAAIQVLHQHNWAEERNSYGFINPRCFRHPSGLVLDLCGYATDQVTGTTISGLWMADIPFEWNRVTRFPKINLIHRQISAGTILYPQHPHELLAALYGPTWQQPDPHFDTIVCAPNIAQHSWLFYCQAYARLYNALQQERFMKMQGMLQVLQSLRPSDALLIGLSAYIQPRINLESPEPKKHEICVLALGYFDLLHSGHINYLNYAKSQGDRLLVGVAPDAFGVRSKGRAPLMNENERLAVISALHMVDHAVLVGAPMAETEAAANWIQQQGVSVVICGDEWRNTPRWNALTERLLPMNIQVVYAPSTQGISSTQIKQRLMG